MSGTTGEMSGGRRRTPGSATPDWSAVEEGHARGEPMFPKHRWKGRWSDHLSSPTGGDGEVPSEAELDAFAFAGPVHLHAASAAGECAQAFIHQGHGILLVQVGGALGGFKHAFAHGIGHECSEGLAATSVGGSGPRPCLHRM